MKTAIIIPARYQSSRFPGKPLTLILGKSLIQRTWERCLLASPPEAIWIATDDERISGHCRQFGAKVVMTSPDCLTGTDRVHDAARQIGADIYINVQGDEPLMDPADILAVMDYAKKHPDAVVNCMTAITEEAEWRNPMIPKVLAAPDGRLLYMSRAPAPTDKKHGFAGAMRQVCVSAFNKKALDAFASAQRKTPLEAIEDLEILRFLELGFEVRMIQASASSISVDVPGDIAKVEAALRKCNPA